MLVNEIFYSIQGEGVWVGIPMVFVRLAGCNLSCSWCDTPDARGRYKGVEISEGDILKKVDGYGCDWVCITGGEPLEQAGEVDELIKRLIEGGYEIIVETNGSLEINKIIRDVRVHISMDWKLPGSKMDSRMLKENLNHLSANDQLKFVVKDKEDYKHAKNVLERNPINSQVIFQPVGGIEIKDLIEWVREDKLKVRLLPQLHKILNIK
ncbi:MAG: hypothetical protein A7316_05325 [Candidatus Altiarchaeales archaeon WOR_SM1_86-2]|nr:MAG: hypothetical protein A7316_05325 [Candidatus Altiarchaeales archaeon WOR_SM1_86-2]